MKKVKVCDLSGAALNWAVATCEGRRLIMRHDYMRQKVVENSYNDVEGMEYQLSNQINELVDLDVTDEASCMAINSTVDMKSINYSGDWALGGAIIDREKIGIMPYGKIFTAVILSETPHSLVPSMTCTKRTQMDANTMLEAAMRCYVKSKLGNEIELLGEMDFQVYVATVEAAEDEELSDFKEGLSDVAELAKILNPKEVYELNHVKRVAKSNNTHLCPLCNGVADNGIPNWYEDPMDVFMCKKCCALEDQEKHVAKSNTLTGLCIHTEYITSSKTMEICKKYASNDVAAHSYNLVFVYNHDSQHFDVYDTASKCLEGDVTERVKSFDSENDLDAYLLGVNS